MTKRSDEPSMAQLRREMRDQRANETRARVLNGQCALPLSMAERLFPADADLAARVRAAVEAWCDTRPDRGATIEQAASHEAGHYGVAEALGMVAGMAEIRGTSGDPRGYSGSAGAMDRPVIDEGRFGFTADDVEREAMFALAGPIAEQLLGGGDAYGSPGEILEGCLLIARLADMRSEVRTATLSRVMTATVRAVLANAGQIEWIAACLKSRRRIHNGVKRVAKILGSIDRITLDGSAALVPEQVEIARKLIADAPVDLAIFAAEVDR